MSDGIKISVANLGFTTMMNSIIVLPGDCDKKGRPEMAMSPPNGYIVSRCHIDWEHSLASLPWSKTPDLLLQFRWRLSYFLDIWVFPVYITMLPFPTPLPLWTSLWVVAYICSKLALYDAAYWCRRQAVAEPNIRDRLHFVFSAGNNNASRRLARIAPTVCSEVQNHLILTNIT